MFLLYLIQLFTTFDFFIHRCFPLTISQLTLKKMRKFISYRFPSFLWKQLMVLQNVSVRKVLGKVYLFKICDLYLKLLFLTVYSWIQYSATGKLAKRAKLKNAFSEKNIKVDFNLVLNLSFFWFSELKFLNCVFILFIPYTL